MIRNITIADLCLIELLNIGYTSAPSEVLRRQARLGYLTITKAGPSLTPAGRKRAKSLKHSEHDLRLQFANLQAGRSAIMTVAGSAFRT